MKNKLDINLSDQKIAVIIPAYNVEASIKDVIENIPEYVKLIVIVNDNSTDSTQEIISKLNLKKVHLLNHIKNLGVGGAMLTGYSYALQFDIDLFIKIDADGQMDPEFIPYLIYQIIIGESDYVKGNRFIHSQELQKMPINRRIGNIGLSFLSKLASGYWDIFDPSNGYTAIHKDILCRLDSRNIDNRYFFETSMLIELNNIRAKVSDVPIPAIYKDNAKSRLSTSHSFISFSYKLIRGFFRRILRQYFLFDFNAVSVFILFGLFFLSFGLIWGITFWYISITTGHVASTGTVLIAALSIILGFQLLIQAITIDITKTPPKSLRSSKFYELFKQSSKYSLEFPGFYKNRIKN